MNLEDGMAYIEGFIRGSIFCDEFGGFGLGVE